MAIPKFEDFLYPFLMQLKDKDISSKEIKEKLRFLIKTTGAGLSPFDSWLIERGIKTLGIRMEKAQQNAIEIANWLKNQSVVTDVFYPGLKEHPGHEIMKKQAGSPKKK